jgi:hypothetical protein
MVPIQKKGRSKRGHKDKVLDMALGSAPGVREEATKQSKETNSQKPPVTETRDLLEGNRQSTSTGISTKRSSGSNLACHTATNREQQA